MIKKTGMYEKGTQKENTSYDLIQFIWRILLIIGLFILLKFLN